MVSNRASFIFIKFHFDNAYVKKNQFTGIIALGLVLLSGRVAIGVANGELDPNKEIVVPVEEGRQGQVKTTSDVMRQIMRNDDRKRD